MSRARARGRSRAAVWLTLGVCLYLSLASGVARAHGRSVSYSRWRVEPATLEYAATLVVPARDLTAIPALEGAPGLARGVVDPGVRAHLLGQIGLHAATGRCDALPGSVTARARAGRVELAWRGRCPDGQAWTLRSRLLVDALPGHVHFARVTVLEGGSSRALERVLSDSARSWSLPASGAGVDATADADARGWARTLARALRLGVEHILSGLDHLLFVLGLVLAARGGRRPARELLRVVTGFTAGHSVTLGLATLGLVVADPVVVEVLIAASITLLAIESGWLHARASSVRYLALLAAVTLTGAAATWAWARPSASPRALALGLLGLGLVAGCQLGLSLRASRGGPGRSGRWALAAVFGLIHGFGFAGALRELELPRAELLPMLLGFNLGVELGQLLFVVIFVVIFAGLLAALARVGAGRWLPPLVNAALAGAGAYWAVLRAFG